MIPYLVRKNYLLFNVMRQTLITYTHNFYPYRLCFIIQCQAAAEKAAKECSSGDHNRPAVISEPQTPAASPEAEAESGVLRWYMSKSVCVHVYAMHFCVFVD